MIAATCRGCSVPMRPGRARAADHPGTRQHQGRGLCNSCYYRQTVRDEFQPSVWRRDDLLAEVEMLIGARGPEDIAVALGTTVTAIERAAYRAGRPELARPFGRVDWRARQAEVRAA